MTLVDQIKLLQLLRAEYKNLRDEIDELETTIAENMEEKQIVIAGVGMVQRREKATRTKWEHEEVFSAVKRYVAGFDDSEGVSQGVELMQTLANPSWRVTKLKEIDIDPDEYCHKESAGYSIMVTEGVIDDK